VIAKKHLNNDAAYVIWLYAVYCRYSGDCTASRCHIIRYDVIVIEKVKERRRASIVIVSHFMHNCRPNLT